MVRNFNTEFASLNPVGKQRLKDEFHNIIVDENSYKNVTGFKAGKLAVANARQNAKQLLLSTAAGEESVVSTDPASFQQQLLYTEPMQISAVGNDNIQSPDLDSLVFLLQDALAKEDKDVVMAMVLKSKKLIVSNSLLKGFSPDHYIVKSLSNSSGSPRVVSIGGNNIRCDKVCPKYQCFGYCSHCLVVAMKENVVVEYAKHLQRKSILSLTQTVSQNVDSKMVGRKVAVKSRKRNIPISPEKSFGTSQDYKFY